jgi:transcriptional regulator with XRE-family HTH domain
MTPPFKKYHFYIIVDCMVNIKEEPAWNRRIPAFGCRIWSMVQEEIQAEIQRLLYVLRVAMRMLDVSNREVEKRLGLSYGYLSRLFSGSIELKVEHILLILDVLGLTPSEFFQLAYPRQNAPLSESAERLHSILRGLGPLPQPEERPAAKAMTAEELEALISKVLRKMLGEKGEKKP